MVLNHYIVIEFCYAGCCYNAYGSSPSKRRHLGLGDHCPFLNKLFFRIPKLFLEHFSVILASRVGRGCGEWMNEIIVLTKNDYLFSLEPEISIVQLLAETKYC